MTSDANAPRSKVRLGVQVGVGIAVGLALAGAVAFWLRLDLPAYELTLLDPVVRVSLDELPLDAPNTQPVTVRVRNTGRRPLRLDRIDTSCICTVVEAVPAEPLPPGGVEEVLLEVTVPNHGRTTANVAIHTDPPAANAAIVELQLRGRTVQTPYMSRLSGPIHLMSRSPREPLAEIVTIETGERVASALWLSGLRASLDGPRAELTSVVDLSTNAAAGVVAREYTFTLTLEGPESADVPVTFTLTPEQSVPSAETPGSIPVRAVLHQAVRAVPERILVVVSDGDEFPLQRQIDIRGADREDRVAVADVGSDVDWIAAELNGDASSTGPSRVVLTIADGFPPDTQASAEVEVTLDSPATAPLRVPVHIIDRRRGRSPSSAETLPTNPDVLPKTMSGPSS